MRRILVAATVFIVSACSSGVPGEDPEGTWGGTIASEGGVTTVLNESGSVWGGPATLVEEASIGVEAGDDEYMFGRITDVNVDQGMIYVVDAQVPAVRVYDLDGEHLMTIGSPGEGPGQYRSPTKVGRTPDGRILVSDFRRINVYRENGEPEAMTYPVERTCCANAAMFIDDEGRPWLPYVTYDCDECPWFLTLRAHDRNGPADDMRPIPEFDVELVQVPAGRIMITPPFAHREIWTVSPSGTIVAGVSNSHRFEVHKAAGEPLVVEKTTEPVRVDPNEADWHRRFTIARSRGALAGWDGAEIPEHKQAFSDLVASVTGETWVVRQGAGMRQPNCVENPGDDPQAAAERPCWNDEVIVDVFGTDGRFLGPVEVPSEMQRHGFFPPPFLSGNMVLAVVSDEGGTIMVKRYRLVPPGEK